MPEFRARTSTTNDGTRLVLVRRLAGVALADHPDLAPYREAGRVAVRAEPRLVERVGLRLLVVLHRRDDERADKGGAHL